MPQVRRLCHTCRQMLRAHLVALAHGGRVLFEDLCWQIAPGERIGLVGVNGAGKTTLLRILARELLPDGGTISLGPNETVGYLPQEAPRATAGSVLDRVLSADPILAARRHALALAEAEMAREEAADAAVAMARCLALAEAQAAYDQAGGHAQVARARRLLAGLGFADEVVGGPLAALSGGWWMRVELARLILWAPTFLLLDEPTNHLDMASRHFLMEVLSAYGGTWVVATHDRHLLRHVATSIAEVGREGLLRVPGGLDDFLAARAAMAEAEAQLAASRAKKLAHMQAFVDRFRAKASKASQVQSRLKMMARAGGATSPTPAASSRVARLSLPAAPRSSQVVLDMEEVAFAYDGAQIIDRFSWTLRRGEKVALVGDNGAGKSTLLKLAAGVLAPGNGKVAHGGQVVPYYFAQHQLEVLDPTLSVLEQMRLLCRDDTVGRLKDLLGAFLFRGDEVDKKVGVLSGGEKSRLVLAQMVSRPYNLLLLDEPTNHLDMATCEVLEAALARFGGSILCISHDRAFVDAIAGGILHLVRGRAPHFHLGDYSSFLARRSAAARVPTDSGAGTGAAAASVGPPSPRRVDARERREAERERRAQARALAEVEAQIDRQEARLRAIDRSLCDPATFADHAGSGDLLRERRDVEAALEADLERWEALPRPTDVATAEKAGSRQG